MKYSNDCSFPSRHLIDCHRLITECFQCSLAIHSHLFLVKSKVKENKYWNKSKKTNGNQEGCLAQYKVVTECVHIHVYVCSLAPYPYGQSFTVAFGVWVWRTISSRVWTRDQGKKVPGVPAVVPEPRTRKQVEWLLSPSQVLITIQPPLPPVASFLYLLNKSGTAVISSSFKGDFPRTTTLEINLELLISSIFLQFDSD